MSPTAVTRWTQPRHVYRPDGQWPWMRSHASMPLPWRRPDGSTRVFHACRDDLNRASIGWVDLDAADPIRVTAVARRPALDLGAPGHFDDCGVYPACLVEREDRLWLYYNGRVSGARMPMFYTCVGLAESVDGGETFTRLFQAPVLGRDEVDPWMASSPCILREGGRYRMWYVSGLPWQEEAGGLVSRFHIKIAESDDGLHWVREGRVALDLGEGELRLSRPCVVHEGGQYQMWFGVDAGQGFRLGHATSPDGLVWTRRDDELGLPPSVAAWDDRSRTNPWVFDVGGRRAMLVNGNAIGRDGFGIALEER